MMTAAEVLAERARRPKTPVQTPAEALNKILRVWARYGANAPSETWVHMVHGPDQDQYTNGDRNTAEPYSHLMQEHITELLMVHVDMTPSRLILSSQERSAHLSEWHELKRYLQSHAEAAGFSIVYCPSGQEITLSLPAAE
jgi:hypothetical protein